MYLKHPCLFIPCLNAMLPLLTCVTDGDQTEADM